MEANDFLKAYMAKNLGVSGENPLIAASVLTPDISDPDRFSMNNRVQQDIPGVADDATVQTIGLYGDELPGDHMARDYGFTHQGASGPQRGIMNFVPGGISAPEGYNMEASRKKYPDYFDGVKEGNVPAFIR